MLKSKIKAPEPKRPQNAGLLSSSYDMPIGTSPLPHEIIFTFWSLDRVILLDDLFARIIFLNQFAVWQAQRLNLVLLSKMNRAEKEKNSLEKKVCETFIAAIASETLNLEQIKILLDHFKDNIPIFLNANRIQAFLKTLQQQFPGLFNDRESLIKALEYDSLIQIRNPEMIAFISHLLDKGHSVSILNHTPLSSLTREVLMPYLDIRQIAKIQLISIPRETNKLDLIESLEEKSPEYFSGLSQSIRFGNTVLIDWEDEKTVTNKIQLIWAAPKTQDYLIHLRLLLNKHSIMDAEDYTDSKLRWPTQEDSSEESSTSEEDFTPVYPHGPGNISDRSPPKYAVSAIRSSSSCPSNFFQPPALTRYSAASNVPQKKL